MLMDTGERVTVMPAMPIERYIVAELADAATEKLVRRCIRKCQRAEPGLLSGSGAANLWDEICVQTQTDSDYSEAYKDHVEGLLLTLAAGLTLVERLAVWLRTYAGECYQQDMEGQTFDPAVLSVSDRDIARHVLPDMLYEAMNYENRRIREMTGR